MMVPLNALRWATQRSPPPFSKESGFGGVAPAYQLSMGHTVIRRGIGPCDRNRRFETSASRVKTIAGAPGR